MANDWDAVGDLISKSATHSFDRTLLFKELSLALEEDLALPEENDPERLLDANAHDLEGGNIIRRRIAHKRLENELGKLARNHQGQLMQLYKETKTILDRFYTQIDHAAVNYVSGKAFYSKLPMVKDIKRQAQKTVTTWREQGEDGPWKLFLPSRATLLACRMANASNSLPELVGGCGLFCICLPFLILPSFLLAD